MIISREETLAAVRERPDVAVLIIGAGVNGIGLFRDLAVQGVRVLMIDKDDFCSGSSAASSHMLHGGVRYLENGEFRLVREALYERNLLLQNAPHYAHPLKTTVPIFKWFSGLLNAPFKFVGLSSKPRERGALVIKVGMMLYDFFIRRNRVMPTHSFSMRSEALKKYPRMNPRIICAATYYDAWMPSPERLCIDLLHDAEAISDDAFALNYTSVEHVSGGEVVLRDHVTGGVFTVRPSIVANAAGAWIDLANRSLGRFTQMIGGTKGSHLVLDHPELHAACAGSEIFFENNDGRIVLILPFLEGRVMVGTTDIRVDDPDAAVCDDNEIEYILGMIDRVFPDIKVDRSQIVFTFCGVRPLPYTPEGRTGQISRDHSVEVIEPGDGLPFPVFSLVGGKWTTFRALSEQAADMILARLGVARQASTANMSIGGGRQYPRGEAAREAWLKSLQDRSGLPFWRVEQLFERYGTRADDVANFCAAEDDGRLENHMDYSRREILYLIREEKVVYVSDLLLRRSSIAMLGQASYPLVAELAGILAQARGWTDEQREQEITRTVELLRQRHRVDLRAEGALV